ncbi:ELWxxDGT repeat protein [Mariniflexile sp.]|uniref:ELWxxDGT repeat protein n=1 Tax=Mariniflexile sp. TaxID=1979402 RepID=UPI00404761DF
MKTKITLLIPIILIVNWHTYSQTPYMVKDINPGTPSSILYSIFSELIRVDNTLFFKAYNPTNGLELWKSDGTSAGTVMVKDINAGTENSNPSHFTIVNGTLFFKANDGINGIELWKSDGTESGTMMVKNIRPSTIDDGYAHIEELTSVGNLLFFAANDGVNDYALWKSDGTEAGTVMVKDINPTTQPTSLGRLININGTLFFGASDGVNGYELWKSDGTEPGTVMVKDILPGSQGGFSSNMPMANVNGTLFFVGNNGYGNRELWKSDGTESGTVMVKDIFPGDNGFASNASNPYQLTNVNGLLFFGANDGVHGPELWKSNGTELGTVLVKDIIPGIISSQLTALSNCNGTLYFQAFDSNGYLDVWKSDGTETGTVLLKNPASGNFYSEPVEFTSLNGYVYFVATGNTIGQELFRTDGTAEGTVGYNIRYLTESSAPANLTVVNNNLFFSADNGGANGRELWALSTVALSVEENSFTESGFRIYPNPAKDILTIKNLSNQTINCITVLDMTGKTVIKQEVSLNQINIETLKQGMYLVQIKVNEQFVVLKFIKN